MRQFEVWAARPAVLASIALAATLVFSGTALAQDYDLVILNGRVMDPETMRDEVANFDLIMKNGVIDKNTLED